MQNDISYEGYKQRKGLLNTKANRMKEHGHGLQ